MSEKDAAEAESAAGMVLQIARAECLVQYRERLSMTDKNKRAFYCGKRKGVGTGLANDRRKVGLTVLQCYFFEKSC